MARVIIVSNRLPVSVKKVDGELQFSQSLGGVATGLSSYAANPNNRWVGWPGIASDGLTEADRRAIVRELRRHNCVPVFLTLRQVEDFYNGYSNSILWPLFHNLPLPKTDHTERWWRAYRSVNQAYSEAVLQYTQTNSRIWVHDYQLMLLPEMLHAARPEVNIGFFLHIPFPEPKVYKRLPEARRLVRGMLGADLIGFHTTSYVNNFLDNCQILEIGSATDGQIILGNRSVRVTDFPMGIDYKKYAESGKSRVVRKAMRKYRRRYRGLKVIVAVDRLDPSKGLVERLQAYRDFLRQNPRLYGKVVLSMVAAPSRTDIAIYQQLKQRLDKLAAEINEEFGNRHWQPLDYMNISLPFEEVTALFRIADVAFIAPIRDGMNLVAKEYVASRRKTGVLILSETAGAAQELTDALLVNPAKRATVVAALEEALTMPKRELKHRFRRMQEQLSKNTVHHWAGNFMKNLQQPVPRTPALRTHLLSGGREQALLNAFRAAQRPLLLLDYDGTLVGLAEDYRRARPPKALLTLLQKLAMHPGAEVVVISGRSQDDLQSWFADLPINLVAEHGALIRTAGHKSWHATVQTGRRWKRYIRPVLAHYAAETPRSHVEEKQYSLVWHYRESPAYQAQKNLAILQRLLRPIAREHGVGVFHGSKILEVKDPHINKGEAIQRWLQRDHDFILAIGDDFTDEDMFKSLPARAFSVKVGRGRTLARYRLPDETAVRQLLKQLARRA